MNISATAVKMTVMGLLGAAGSFVSGLFGGWNGAMTTLLIFMAIDYLSGIICAGVFKKSEKSENGALESKAGFKGLCKKGMILLIVLVAARLDVSMGSNYLKDAAVIAFSANEALSIIENAGLMGVPMPAVITKAVTLLKNKSDADKKENEDA